MVKMKSLLVLRHAKSDRHDPDLEDRDRPLNGRGRHDARRIGRLVRAEQLLPDLIMTSTARRARETVDLVVSTSSYTGEVTVTRSFYLAGPEVYLGAVSELDHTRERVMVVGHNPGLEELVRQLTGTAITISTATLVEIGLPIARWRELDEQTRGELKGVWRPRELP